MKTCDHCGRSCKKRVAVKLRGRVGMVGVGCAKHFKRIKRSDLFRATTIVGSPDQPPQLTEDEFHKKFSSKIVNTKLLLSGHTRNIVEWYAWQGGGLAVQHVAGAIKWPYYGKILVKVYDPYVGKIQEIINLEYKKNPALGDIVEQYSEKHQSGFSSTVQSFLDAYPKWDPIAKHVPGATPNNPAAHPAATVPVAVKSTANFILGINTDASGKYRSWKDLDAHAQPIRTGSPVERDRQGLSFSQEYEITGDRLNPARSRVVIGSIKYLNFGSVPYESEFDDAFSRHIDTYTSNETYTIKWIPITPGSFSRGIPSSPLNSSELYEYVIRLINRQFDQVNGDFEGDYDLFSLAAAILLTLGFAWPET